jgi:DNA-directed RNA polymerase subunit RPC12/RpoP
MALLNECVICDKQFLETNENPGNVCEDCRKDILEEKGEEYVKPEVANG